MSSQNFSSSTSFSYSSSSNGQSTGHARTETIESGPEGTKVTREMQNLGEPATSQTRHYDSQGRELIEGPDGKTSNRITDAEQAENDRKYEERIEDEYAKREGGA